MRAKLADAVTMWQRGKHQEAERCCTALLATAGEDPAAARGLLAEIYSSRGQFRAASEQLHRIAQHTPTDAAVWRRLGDSQFACNEFTAAAQSFERAIELDPKQPRAYNNLGRALAELSQHEASIERFRQAIALSPDYAVALNNLGIALARKEDLQEALGCYVRARALDPKFAQAIANQGNVLLRLERAEEALACFERAIILNPANVTTLCNCGNALLQLRRLPQALACFEQALRLIPDFPLGLVCRANALKEMRRFPEALLAYERAITLSPDDLDARCNRAGTLMDMERFEEAIRECDQMLLSRPDYPQALMLRGMSLSHIGGSRYEESVRDLSRLWEVAPTVRYALGNLLHMRSMVYDWSEPERVADAIDAMLADKPVISPVALLALSDDAQLQLRCARSCVSLTHPPAEKPIWQGEQWRNPKIRIAYVSGDLREHAVSFLMAGVFEQHDRDKFEIFGLSLKEPTNNAFGARIVSALDAFVDLRDQTDQQAAQLMYDMQIDIAVDLMGMTRGNRQSIFAHRAVPVQVNYIGYPGSSGAPYIDYILADEYVIPPESRQHYCESVVYLPDCYQPNDDRRFVAEARPTRSEMGLPEQGFVFCSFNNSYKITPQMFDIWCRLLRERPGSVLWMLAESSLAQSNLLREAEQRGVDPKRVIFAQRTLYDAHLSRLQLADLFLDSLPFNAGTTASDALWAGLPVLTCPGRAFAARMAGSLLRSIGLPGLIATDLEDYERLALQLSGAPEQLQTLRSRLAMNRTTHALFDTRRICRHLESAYQTMHERRLQGLSPAHFAVSAIG